MSLTLISELMGRSRTQTKAILYKYGIKEKNTLTTNQIGELICEERMKGRLTDLRKQYGNSSDNFKLDSDI